MALSGVDGVSEHAGLLAEPADRGQRAVEMRAGFGVHGDDVGAGFGERLQIGIAGLDHQMDVEDLIAVRAQRLHDIGADGDVGHEMAVHHIDMDPVASGVVDCAHLFAEAREICRQDGRRDNDRALLHCAYAAFAVPIRGSSSPDA